MYENTAHGFIHGVYGMMKKWTNPNDYICMKIQPMDLSMEIKGFIHGRKNIHGRKGHKSMVCMGR